MTMKKVKDAAGLVIPKGMPKQQSVDGKTVTVINQKANRPGIRAICFLIKHRYP
jgi:hypothetical protein